MSETCVRCAVGAAVPAGRRRFSGGAARAWGRMAEKGMGGSEVVVVVVVRGSADVGIDGCLGLGEGL